MAAKPSDWNRTALPTAVIGPALGPDPLRHLIRTVDVAIGILEKRGDKRSIPAVALAKLRDARSSLTLAQQCLDAEPEHHADALTFALRGFQLAAQAEIQAAQVTSRLWNEYRRVQAARGPRVRAATPLDEWILKRDGVVPKRLWQEIEREPGTDGPFYIQQDRLYQSASGDAAEGMGFDAFKSKVSRVRSKAAHAKNLT